LKEPPVTVFVCVGKIGASDIPAEAQVIEKVRLGIETGNNVAQALAIGQLPKAKG